MTQTPAEKWATAKIDALWRGALVALSRQLVAQSLEFQALARVVR